MVIFSAALFKKARENGRMRQADFAKKLGVTKSYVSAIEKGIREPSVEVIRRLVHVTGIPVWEWLPEETASGVTGVTLDMRNRRNRDHLEIQRRDEEIWRLEQANDRQTAKIKLYEDSMDISYDNGISKDEKEERFRKLVIRTIREGELNFSEVRKITRIRRSTIRNWLDEAKQPYECAQADGGMIMAASPGEAAICLRCDTCMKREDGHCLGYGDEHPANIREMFELLDAHGLYNATELSVIFEKYYNLKYSAAYVTNIRYKINNGIRLPDDVYYMDTEKRDV